MTSHNAHSTTLRACPLYHSESMVDGEIPLGKRRDRHLVSAQILMFSIAPGKTVECSRTVSWAWRVPLPHWYCEACVRRIGAEQRMHLLDEHRSWRNLIVQSLVCRG